MNKEETEAIKYFKELRYGEINDNNKEILLNLIDKLQQENAELTYKLEVEKIDNKYNQEEASEEMIPKYKLRKFIKENLPDDEIMECCEIYAMNGVYLRKKLEELLGE